MRPKIVFSQDPNKDRQRGMLFPKVMHALPLTCKSYYGKQLLAIRKQGSETT